ncbi:restriction endonuclease [Chitinophaga niabensis]|uniref:Restriction endonuclease n=1 Tax=Chitinophaga niabensis TaxID=536979 RepID=A0A1N6KAI8_9BACT|nr:restriction endonuclease [Chitinophaga niabensis]SIO53570.1 Restriction endonuclease [Chitinophaga niabensis]
MSTSHEKGLSLENALQRLQESVISKLYDCNKAKIIVEPRKILITPEGNKEEIDLYVEIEHSEIHKTILIFECKNWDSKSVDKDIVTVFADKIDLCGAQDGYVIAKSFTSGAYAKANAYPRVKLLVATEDLEAVKKVAEIDISYTKAIPTLLKVDVSGFMNEDGVFVDPSMEIPPDVTIIQHGVESSFKEYFDKRFDFENFIRDSIKHVQDIGDQKAFYEVSKNEQWDFEDNCIKFRGELFHSMKLKVGMQVYFCRAKFNYAFDIEKNGQYCQQEFEDENGRSVVVDIIRH